MQGFYVTKTHKGQRLVATVICVYAVEFLLCILTTLTTGETAWLTGGSGPNLRLLLACDFSSRITKGLFGTGGRPLGVLAELGEPISAASRGLFAVSTIQRQALATSVPQLDVVVLLCET